MPSREGCTVVSNVTKSGSLTVLMLKLINRQN
jgi:hypothetical protein